MDKQKIIANIKGLSGGRRLSAEELFDEIRHGNITLRELIATQKLSMSERKEIEVLQIQFDREDNDDWERARNGDEKALNDYINGRPDGKHVQEAKEKKDDMAWERVRYSSNEIALSNYITNNPCGKHVEEAKEKIRYMEEERRRAQAAKQRILNKLKENPNSFTPGEVKAFLQSTITENDLLDCGIPDEICRSIDNVKRPDLQLGSTPNSIPGDYTEVYFWGTPGSGKTCALAAILNTAEKAGYLDIAIGPGYKYMLKLKNIFLNKRTVLPRPTLVDDTQYLPFVLRKGNDKPRSVSLIELSGEIFQCFLKEHIGEELTGKHKNTFNALI
ncbi:MAG: hypothetical protein LBK97_07980, partial [Prevotellaceae bacterium]|nr:hypothetical protein [Prevotellaceae bacterium]